VRDDWQPTTAISALRLRANVLDCLRRFFWARDVLEVETPLLGHACGTDAQLDFFSAQYCAPPIQETLFLQTSPEFAMKRLLAAGSGSIYQICKAFRNGESGRYHNPEFTMLEWYRVGFTLTDLMDEIAELIRTVSVPYRTLEAPQRLSYQDVFVQYTGLDPLVFCVEAYSACAQAKNQPEALNLCGDDHVLWLDYIFSHFIQPFLGVNAVCLIYGYPACQSSLARLNLQNPLVTERVEVFIDGIELGNGYYELSDAQEQKSRFEAEIAERQLKDRPDVVMDERLLAALETGLPECAGVAIGIDRLLMVLSASKNLSEVINFPFDRA